MSSAKILEKIHSLAFLVQSGEKKTQKVIGFCAQIWNLDICENKRLRIVSTITNTTAVGCCICCLSVRLSVAIVRLPTACDLCRCQYLPNTFEPFRNFAYNYRQQQQQIYIFTYIYVNMWLYKSLLLFYLCIPFSIVSAITLSIVSNWKCVLHVLLHIH